MNWTRTRLVITRHHLAFVHFGGQRAFAEKGTAGAYPPPPQTPIFTPRVLGEWTALSKRATFDLLIKLTGRRQ